MEYSFASFIENYLKTKYGDDAEQLFSMSYILQYIVHKTKSANKGAKYEAVLRTFMLCMLSLKIILIMALTSTMIM